MEIKDTYTIVKLHIQLADRDNLDHMCKVLSGHSRSDIETAIQRLIKEKLVCETISKGRIIYAWNTIR